MKHFLKKFGRYAALALSLAMLTGCNADKTPSELPETTQPSETVTDAVTEIAPETVPETEPETEVPPETEAETEVPTLPSEDELLTEVDSDISGYSDDPETDEDTTPVNETPTDTKKDDSKSDTATEPTPEPEEPKRIFNYLNGTTVTEEERDRRPVAIMLNNLKKSLPQEGLCSGDVYYECAAEGGITRLMMLVSDIDDLGTVGSVRSSRDYFVDFIANHDAIYVHAGGSELAYAKIGWRGIDNLDGVNMYLPSTFWRDTWRMYNIGYEHSMMTSGEGIAAGIKQKGYRTTLDEAQVPMFNFYDEETDHQLIGSPAPHVHMISTSIQTVDFVYDSETGEYLRYQYNGTPHVDGTTGEQLSVKNVIILFTDIALIPGDAAGRLSVGTVGSGQGYYITNGKRKVINWSRETKTSTVHLEYRNGDELILNSGKTFICVVDDSVAGKIDFEYEW